jgi:hypothetical protein
MQHEQEHAALAPRFLGRRRLMQIGGLGCLGLNLAGLLRAETTQPAAPRRADRIRSCILGFYYGGPSHLDTWDLKPNAPAEVRGEFRPIATRVPGLRVGEQRTICFRLPIERFPH